MLPPHAELVERLRQRLAQPLPGAQAQLTMAPAFRPLEPETFAPGTRDCREAAVLVLLYPGLDDQSTLVLTERHADLPDHPGQISFPGGSIDPGETAEEAALREAFEEVGVPVEAPEVLGALSGLWIPPTNFCVTPLVAALARRPTFVPEAAEVAAVLEMPLALLADPEARRTEPQERFGKVWDIPYFDLEGRKVWGATAIMLAELAAVLETV